MKRFHKFPLFSLNALTKCASNNSTGLCSVRFGDETRSLDRMGYFSSFYRSRSISPAINDIQSSMFINIKSPVVSSQQIYKNLYFDAPHKSLDNLINFNCLPKQNEAPKVDKNNYLAWIVPLKIKNLVKKPKSIRKMQQFIDSFYEKSPVEIECSMNDCRLPGDHKGKKKREEECRKAEKEKEEEEEDEEKDKFKSQHANQCEDMLFTKKPLCKNLSKKKKKCKVPGWKKDGTKCGEQQNLKNVQLPSLFDMEYVLGKETNIPMDFPLLEVDNIPPQKIIYPRKEIVYQCSSGCKVPGKGKEDPCEKKDPCKGGKGNKAKAVEEGCRKFNEKRRPKVGGDGGGKDKKDPCQKKKKKKDKCKKDDDPCKPKKKKNKKGKKCSSRNENDGYFLSANNCLLQTLKNESFLEKMACNFEGKQPTCSKGPVFKWNGRYPACNGLDSFKIHRQIEEENLEKVPINKSNMLNRFIENGIPCNLMGIIDCNSRKISTNWLEDAKKTNLLLDNSSFCISEQPYSTSTKYYILDDNKKVNKKVSNNVKENNIPNKNTNVLDKEWDKALQKYKEIHEDDINVSTNDSSCIKTNQDYLKAKNESINDASCLNTNNNLNEDDTNHSCFKTKNLNKDDAFFKTNQDILTDDLKYKTNSIIKNDNYDNFPIVKSSKLIDEQFPEGDYLHQTHFYEAKQTLDDDVLLKLDNKEGSTIPSKPHSDFPDDCLNETKIDKSWHKDDSAKPKEDKIFTENPCDLPKPNEDSCFHRNAVEDPCAHIGPKKKKIKPSQDSNQKAMPVDDPAVNSLTVLMLNQDCLDLCSENQDNSAKIRQERRWKGISAMEVRNKEKNVRKFAFKPLKLKSSYVDTTIDLPIERSKEKNLNKRYKRQITTPLTYAIETTENKLGENWSCYSKKYRMDNIKDQDAEPIFKINKSTKLLFFKTQNTINTKSIHLSHVDLKGFNQYDFNRHMKIKKSASKTNTKKTSSDNKIAKTAVDKKNKKLNNVFKPYDVKFYRNAPPKQNMLTNISKDVNLNLKTGRSSFTTSKRNNNIDAHKISSSSKNNNAPLSISDVHIKNTLNKISDKKIKNIKKTEDLMMSNTFYTKTVFIKLPQKKPSRIPVPINKSVHKSTPNILNMSQCRINSLQLSPETLLRNSYYDVKNVNNTETQKKEKANEKTKTAKKSDNILKKYEHFEELLKNKSLIDSIDAVSALLKNDKSLEENGYVMNALVTHIGEKYLNGNVDLVKVLMENAAKNGLRENENFAKSECELKNTSCPQKMRNLVPSRIQSSASMSTKKSGKDTGFDGLNIFKDLIADTPKEKKTDNKTNNANKVDAKPTIQVETKNSATKLSATTFKSSVVKTTPQNVNKSDDFPLKFPLSGKTQRPLPSPKLSTKNKKRGGSTSLHTTASPNFTKSSYGYDSIKKPNNFSKSAYSKSADSNKGKSMSEQFMKTIKSIFKMDEKSDVKLSKEDDKGEVQTNKCKDFIFEEIKGKDTCLEKELKKGPPKDMPNPKDGPVGSPASGKPKKKASEAEKAAKNYGKLKGPCTIKLESTVSEEAEKDFERMKKEAAEDEKLKECLKKQAKKETKKCEMKTTCEEEIECKLSVKEKYKDPAEEECKTLDKDERKNMIEQCLKRRCNDLECYDDKKRCLEYVANKEKQLDECSAEARECEKLKKYECMEKACMQMCSLQETEKCMKDLKELKRQDAIKEECKKMAEKAQEELKKQCEELAKEAESKRLAEEAMRAKAAEACEKLRKEEESKKQEAEKKKKEACEKLRKEEECKKQEAERKKKEACEKLRKEEECKKLKQQEECKKLAAAQNDACAPKQDPCAGLEKKDDDCDKLKKQAECEKLKKKEECKKLDAAKKDPCVKLKNPCPGLEKKAKGDDCDKQKQQEECDKLKKEEECKKQEAEKKKKEECEKLKREQECKKQAEEKKKKEECEKMKKEAEEKKKKEECEKMKKDAECKKQEEEKKKKEECDKLKKAAECEKLKKEQECKKLKEQQAADECAKLKEEQCKKQMEKDNCGKLQKSEEDKKKEECEKLKKQAECEQLKKDAAKKNEKSKADQESEECKKLKLKEQCKKLKEDEDKKKKCSPKDSEKMICQQFVAKLDKELKLKQEQLEAKKKPKNKDADKVDCEVGGKNNRKKQQSKHEQNEELAKMQDECQGDPKKDRKDDKCLKDDNKSKEGQSNKGYEGEVSLHPLELELQKEIRHLMQKCIGKMTLQDRLKCETEAIKEMKSIIEDMCKSGQSSEMEAKKKNCKKAFEEFCNIEKDKLELCKKGEGNIDDELKMLEEKKACLQKIIEECRKACLLEENGNGNKQSDPNECNTKKYHTLSKAMLENFKVECKGTKKNEKSKSESRLSEKKICEKNSAPKVKLNGSSKSFHTLCKPKNSIPTFPKVIEPFHIKNAPIRNPLLLPQVLEPKKEVCKKDPRTSTKIMDPFGSFFTYFFTDESCPKKECPKEEKDSQCPKPKSFYDDIAITTTMSKGINDLKGPGVCGPCKKYQIVREPKVKGKPPLCTQSACSNRRRCKVPIESNLCKSLPKRPKFGSAYVKPIEFASKNVCVPPPPPKKSYPKGTATGSTCSHEACKITTPKPPCKPNSTPQDLSESLKKLQELGPKEIKRDPLEMARKDSKACVGCVREGKAKSSCSPYKEKDLEELCLSDETRQCHLEQEKKEAEQLLKGCKDPKPVCEDSPKGAGDDCSANTTISPECAYKAANNYSVQLDPCPKLKAKPKEGGESKKQKKYGFFSNVCSMVFSEKKPDCKKSTPSSKPSDSKKFHNSATVLNEDTSINDKKDSPQEKNAIYRARLSHVKNFEVEPQKVKKDSFIIPEIDKEMLIKRQLTNENLNNRIANQRMKIKKSPEAVKELKKCEIETEAEKYGKEFFDVEAQREICRRYSRVVRSDFKKPDSGTKEL